MARSPLRWQFSDPIARRYVIIRHAEKTGLPGDRNLSSEGRARAQALRSLPKTLGTIDAIIAAKSVPKSARPVETVEPLAEVLGLTIDTRWNTHEVAELASAIMSDRSLDGRQILICWRHDALQDVAHAFGARHAPAWPGTLYDRTWLLTCSADSADLLGLRQIPADGTVRFTTEP